MTNFINLTPHTINLNNGNSFPASGNVARVANVYGDFDENGIASVSFGEVTNLPEAQEGVVYIVSGLVAQAISGRNDVVSPATGHPDCVRDGGRIVSVPGFVRNV